MLQSRRSRTDRRSQADRDRPPRPLRSLRRDRQPGGVAELAADAGCTAIALTDHDRLDGIETARNRGRELGVDVVGGCELSCTTTSGTLHLLAYFVDDGDGCRRSRFSSRWT